MGSPSLLSNPLFNMGFLLISMQLAKKIEWEDPNVLTFARIGYFGAQLLVVGLSYALIAVINKKNDTTILTYESPAKPSLSGETSAPQTITTTIRDYDVDQMHQFIKSTLTSVVVISIMHFKFGFTQPLLMQSIMPIKNLLAHKEALIHLWGDAPEGNLFRPFPAENPLGALSGMFGGGGNTVDPAAAAAAADGASTTTTATSNSAGNSDNHSKKD